ncbi:centrosomal protein of 135 kDa-like [Corythoichthys intestinalis]|uniref:centrosomal protein of 135 kDa-like n=1 Tax=Corythoichthys intestinalis TaxID=161448 RepID=UPI0025A5DD5A|nr:centrosomal protein of 135 kDa-like [Corythoichthys intestinalis]XP_057697808.1 centrosomal protein of 135 kDa-like [Corythoichthys intestinalis]
MQTHEVVSLPDKPTSKSPDHGDERQPVTDERQENINKVKSDLENAHGCIKILLTQVAERDKEIDNLNHALHGPHHGVSLETQNNTNKKLISYLNLQIEYLQEGNKTLEQRIQGLQQKASAEVADLSLRNMHLCRQLTQKNTIMKQTKMDKKRVLDIAYRNLSASKEVIISQQEVIKDLEDNLLKIRGELPDSSSNSLHRIVDLEKAVQNLERERLELRSQLSSCKDSKSDTDPRWDFQPAERLQNTKEEVAAAQRKKAARALGQLQGAPKSLEGGLANLPKQLGTTQQCIVSENTRLQDDMTTLNREKQAANAGMEEVLRERDQLKLSVHSYINAMYRIEEMMRTKDQENFELVERLQTAQSNLQEREQRLQVTEDLVSAIDVELRKAQECPAALLADLACVRELCARLDSDKELTSCELTSKRMELDIVRSETESLKKQLECEKMTVRNLEMLLATALQKVSEKEAKLKALRDRLTTPTINITGDCNANLPAPQRQTEVNGPTNLRPTREQHVSFRD